MKARILAFCMRSLSISSIIAITNRIAIQLLAMKVPASSCNIVKDNWGIFNCFVARE